MSAYILDMETLTPAQHAAALRRFETKFIPEPNSGCWLWLGVIERDGYGRFRLRGHKDWRAHRFAWLLYRGEHPSHYHVLHRCDVPICVNPAHLFLGTIKDNNADRARKGRYQSMALRGQPKVKLTKAEAEWLRLTVEGGFMTRRKVAKALGITPSHAGRIVSGHHWK